MTNEQMKENRYLRWHKARKRVAWIKQNLAAGRTVQLTTYTKATRYTTKHIDWFKATKTGAYVQQGKGFVCIDGCDVRAFA
jgi:hypothetical protein